MPAAACCTRLRMSLARVLTSMADCWVVCDSLRTSSATTAKAAPGLASAGGFDGGVQRQQIGLVGISPMVSTISPIWRAVAQFGDALCGLADAIGQVGALRRRCRPCARGSR